MPRKYLPHSYVRRAPYKTFIDEQFDAAYPTLAEAQDHVITLVLETDSPFVHIEGPSPDGTTLRWEPSEIFFETRTATWDVSTDPF